MLDNLEYPGRTRGGAAPSCGTQCRIFVTVASYDGNLGGIAGADQQCMADPARPVSNTQWKALLVDGITRRACESDNCSTNGAAENIDWILRPQTAYYRATDNQLIGITNNSGIFLFPIVQPIGVGSGNVWTGIKNPPYLWTSSHTCNGWQDATGSYLGTYAQLGVTGDAAVSSNFYSCTNSAKLYCVEQ